MAFVGFVGTLGTTKIVATPKDDIKQEKIETKNDIDFGSDNIDVPIINTTENNYISIYEIEGTVFGKIFKYVHPGDLVYMKDGHYTAEQWGNPVGIIQSIGYDSVNCCCEIQLYGKYL